MFARTVRTLMQARRYALLALAAALLAMTFATSAAAQDWGPEGDLDGDGVTDAQDNCPGDGTAGGVTADGCPDGDGDGYSDQYDICPDRPTNEYSDEHIYGQGCPGKPPYDAGPDTPPAAGPSCTKTMPCLVFARKGLSEKRSGGYSDPDATVSVTIARDARGVPARVVDVKLSNVDSRCQHYDKKTGEYSVTPGPEVSASLDPFALRKRRYEYANGGFYNVFVFDPLRPVRTINGVKYELGFEMDLDAREVELMITAPGLRNDGTCTINMYGNNDRLTREKSAGANAEGKEAVEKAVAKCKKMPAGTKKQRRKRKKCLKNART